VAPLACLLVVRFAFGFREGNLPKKVYFLSQGTYQGFMPQELTQDVQETCKDLCSQDLPKEKFVPQEFAKSLVLRELTKVLG